MYNSLVGRSLGQYDIKELIGHGGMATVYRAEQSSIGRSVAVKVLNMHPGMDAQFVERFKLEAKTIGSLQNPHILPLYDYGTEAGILYLVMAFADAGSLADIMEDGPLSLRQVARTLDQVASALDYAHRRGIIHRDIKPANILLDGEHNALLADFGIVKMLEGDARLTATGILGTPSYMSPEQGQGLEIDARSDIYSLAVMVFEMLSGKTPYQATTPLQVIVQHVNAPVPRLSDLGADFPAELTDVLFKAMAKDPNDRYQRATDFAQAFFSAIQAGGDTAARSTAIPLVEQPTAMPTSPRVVPQSTPTIPFSVDEAPAQSSRFPIILGAFGAVAALLLIVFVITSSQPASIPSTPTADAEAEIINTEVAALTTPEGSLVSTSVAVAPAQDAPAVVRYRSSAAPGDTVNISARSLQPVAAGVSYQVWLLNTASGETLSLGKLSVDAFGEGLLVYTDSEGRLLPAWYNAVVINSEADLADAPSEAILYSGRVPIEVTQSLYEIVVASEDGLGGGSLLDGMRTEAGFATQHAGLAARARSVGGMRQHVEHTINILLGTTDDYDGDGRASNPGRGVGVFFFAEEINGLIDQALNTPGASIDLQLNAELMRVCIQNSVWWGQSVLALEQTMLEAESIEAVVDEATESTILTGYMTTGVDANENGLIEPFEGECGIQQVPNYALLMGNLSIVEGDLAEE